MNTYAFVLLSAALILCGCRSATTSTTTEPTARTITGGYTSVDVADTDVRMCAEYAVAQQNPPDSVRLIAIENAQRQVVAGMNYKLLLNVYRNGNNERVRVVVWSKLDGTKEVTSWEVE